MTTPSTLPFLKPTQALLAALESLRPLKEAGPDPRADAILLLESKVLPELLANLELPLFVGIQGGTNVGKSTVFNALSGRILSPAIVVASATKHPLVYLHERWRPRFLGSNLFPHLTSEELQDPNQLITNANRSDVLYFRFHNEARLEAVALIDSPDFDGALLTSLDGAERIAAISDVTLFVTTAQKYRDRLLVSRLQRLLELKGEVVLVFNRVDEQIVLDTILDDLRQAVGPGAETLKAIQISTSGARHPEEEMRASLESQILERLISLENTRLKRCVVTRTIRKSTELAEAAVSIYSAEAAFKRELKKLVETSAQESKAAYSASFQLALPEETLAIRRMLRITEVGPYLSLDPDLERSSKTLSLVGASIRRLNDTIRRVMVRLSRSDQGTLEATDSALKDYARARDLADTECVLRALEPLRVKVESFVRSRSEISALASELVRVHFTPQAAAGFALLARNTHLETLGGATRTGAEILSETEQWIQKNTLKTRWVAVGAIATKVGLGAFLAWALPPGGGFFVFLQPLKWIYFSAGYLLGAYLVAGLIAWRLRGRKSFKLVREKAMETTLRRTLLEPLERATDNLLMEKDLRRVTSAAKELTTLFPQVDTPVRW